MCRKLCMLVFALGITATCIGGLLSPSAQAATCTPHCFMPDCGDWCCTYSNCLTHCVHVFCQG
jgi:hypothetical protein